MSIGVFQEIPPTMYNQGLWDISLTKKHPLGTIRPLSDGRVFVYAKAGASALTAGHCQTFITTPVHETTVTVAHAIGVQDVTVTAAAVSAGDYEDGILVITGGTGIGECYKIRTNSATASGVIVVKLYDPLVTAWVVANTDVDIYKNPYNGLILNPVDGQQHVVGVPQRPVTALYYCWIQIMGFGAMIVTAGTGGLEFDEKAITPSTATAGEGIVDAAPASQTANTTGMQLLGHVVMEEDVTDAEATLVKMCIG